MNDANTPHSPPGPDQSDPRLDAVRREALDLSRFVLEPGADDFLEVASPAPGIAVRKPRRQEFFRAHPDAAFRWRVLLLIDDQDREHYVVAPELFDELHREAKLHQLRRCVGRDGTEFLLPIPLPDPDGNWNAWHRSREQVAREAESCWVRMCTNKDVGVYETLRGRSDPAPTWQQGSPVEVFERAFRGRAIVDLGHPLVRRLRGEE